jgi:hypothetical protein
MQLQDFFNQNGYHHLASQSYKFFTESKMYFIRNNDKSVMPYITQFKLRIISPISLGYTLNQSVCDDVSRTWLNNPMKNNPKKMPYATPLELMQKLISQDNTVTTYH